MRRLHYFDMLKGLAIFLVVMGHVITFCVREIDRSVVFKFIENIHMPLFFFISGWFTYKISDNNLSMPKLGPRALQLLVPMVVVSSLWIWYFPHSGLQSPLDSTFHGLWSSTWKNGYWFTPVLFMITAIYAALVMILRHVRSIFGWITSSFVVWAALIVIMYLLAYANIEIRHLLDYFSFELLVVFFPSFMAGVIASRWRDAFLRLTCSGTVVTVCLLAGSVLLYMLSWPWEFSIFGYSDVFLILAKSLFHIMLAIVAIAVVRPWSEMAFSEGARPFTASVARIWEMLGRKSLAIYMLHYFFLFPLGVYRHSLESVGLGFVPILFFAAAGAVAIISVVLAVDYIIGKSPLLAMLLTGQRIKRNQK